jgi:hypothetical protein
LRPHPRYRFADGPGRVSTPTGVPAVSLPLTSHHPGRPVRVRSRRSR